MDIRLMIHYGPLEAEVKAAADDEYQKEFLELLEFFEDHRERIHEIEYSGQHTGEEDSKKSTDVQTTLTESSQEDDVTTSGVLKPVERKTGIGVDKLERILYVDPDCKEPPEIMIDDPAIFGNSKKAKQKSASLILLYLWDIYSEEETIHSSDLKDALTSCGVDPSNLFNMYDKDFRKSGGNNRQLSLTRSGELQAQDEISDLVEKVIDE